MLQIDGVKIASPSQCTIEVEDAGGAEEQSADGGLVMDRVGVRRRLTLKWAMMTAAQMREFMAKTSARSFTVTYPDPETGALRSMLCHCGARSAALYRMDRETPIWTEVAAVFTQVNAESETEQSV